MLSNASKEEVEGTRWASMFADIPDMYMVDALYPVLFLKILDDLIEFDIVGNCAHQQSYRSRHQGDTLPDHISRDGHSDDKVGKVKVV